jgi:hypothetical protein
VNATLTRFVKKSAGGCKGWSKHVASLVDSPTAAAAGTTIIYRRSDTIGGGRDLVQDPRLLVGARPTDIAAALATLSMPFTPGVQVTVVADTANATLTKFVRR